MDNHVLKEKFHDKEAILINQISNEKGAQLDEFNRLLLSDRSAKFIANPIIYVGGNEASSDSSDDEPLPKKQKYDDSQHKTEFDDLVISKFNLKSLPYRQFKITKSRAEKTYNEDKISEPISFVKNEKVNLSDNAVNIAQKFVKKLGSTGLEEGDCDKIENVVSASILLNRPLSIGTRKNNLLENKSDNKSEKITSTPINVTITGVFWIFQWYDSSNNEVDYDKVRQFYKQLKKYDRIYKTSKAKKFKEIAELGTPVPYRKLREHAKNQVKVSDLVKNNENSDVYLSIVDGDTVSFNGIYSAYKRIHSESYPSPKVMSTGYEYAKGAFELASQIDRNIRVITNRYVPGGVYFPEPNTCVLIPRGLETLEENFIFGKNQNQQSLETAYLLKHIISKDREATLIFSLDKPLITSLPNRAKLTKVHKTPISFSYEFSCGSSPTKEDIKSLKQVTQSHYHESVWYNSLFINNAIEIKKGRGFQFRCKHLLAQIRNDMNTNNATSELKKYIAPEVVDNIKKAAKKVNEYIDKFKLDVIRSEDEDELLKHLNIKGISDEEKRLIFSQQDVLKLIREKKLSVDDITQLKESDVAVLEFIFYNQEVVEALYNKDIDVPTLLKLLEEYWDECSEAINSYSFAEILKRYEDDPRHLHFMGEDPNEFMLENSKDDDLVAFGMEHYSDVIDFSWYFSIQQAFKVGLFDRWFKSTLKLE